MMHVRDSCCAKHGTNESNAGKEVARLSASASSVTGKPVSCPRCGGRTASLRPLVLSTRFNQILFGLHLAPSSAQRPVCSGQLSSNSMYASFLFPADHYIVGDGSPLLPLHPAPAVYPPASPRFLQHRCRFVYPARLSANTASSPGCPPPPDSPSMPLSPAPSPPVSVAEPRSPFSLSQTRRRRTRAMRTPKRSRRPRRRTPRARARPEPLPPRTPPRAPCRGQRFPTCMQEFGRSAHKVG